VFVVDRGFSLYGCDAVRLRLGTGFVYPSLLPHVLVRLGSVLSYWPPPPPTHGDGPFGSMACPMTTLFINIVFVL